VSAPIRVAIVEDDAILREELAWFLGQHGFETLVANSGRGLDDLLPVTPVDVVVLDLNLPGESGFEIARRLKRHNPAIGVVMLTARSALPDRVKGYESGADIYLAKPVPAEELKAAIVSLHRRLGGQGQAPAWLLDREQALIRPPAGHPDIALTAKELAFLLLFARAAQDTLESTTVCELMEPADSTEPLSKRALENIVSRLRKKLQPFADSQQPLIRSVWGSGYQLCCTLKETRLSETSPLKNRPEAPTRPLRPEPGTPG
jgi:DNA-binding response OmpR family regulator